MTMYTVNEVAKKILHLSRSKVYELLDRGRLGYHRFDGAIRISQKQIDEYLAKTEFGPREPTRRKPRLQKQEWF